MNTLQSVHGCKGTHYLRDFTDIGLSEFTIHSQNLQNLS